MATFHDLRTRFVRALSPRDIRATFRIDRGIAPDIIPIIERLAPGTDEAVTALYAILPYFRDERPITAIVRGKEITLYEEGPRFHCGRELYPLGGQLFVDRVGWINLGPVDTAALHSRLREAIDQAAFRWISERGKLPLASPCRQPRVRAIDDYLARLEMEAAVAAPIPESPADHV